MRRRRFIYDEELGRCVEVDSVQQLRKHDGAAYRTFAPDASGVHPSQIAEAMEHDRKHGVPTNYTRDGRPIITSRNHYKRHNKIHGLYDRNGGYGDAMPNNR